MPKKQHRIQCEYTTLAKTDCYHYESLSLNMNLTVWSLILTLVVQAWYEYQLKWSGVPQIVRELSGNFIVSGEWSPCPQSGTVSSFSALMLNVWWQEGNPACKSSATTIPKMSLLGTGQTWCNSWIMCWLNRNHVCVLSFLVEIVYLVVCNAYMLIVICYLVQKLCLCFGLSLANISVFVWWLFVCYLYVFLYSNLLLMLSFVVWKQVLILVVHSTPAQQRFNSPCFCFQSGCAVTVSWALSGRPGSPLPHFSDSHGYQ